MLFQLVFNTEKIVAWCSKLFTLLPGDLILTGTPPGVGVFMKPPEFLKVSGMDVSKHMSYLYIYLTKINIMKLLSQKGDVVECSIDGIGTVRNTVV